MPEKKTKKRDRSRNKKVLIVGPSVELNGKIYGASAMQTNYESSMALPDKEKVQEICAEAYMKLLALFTAPPLLGLSTGEKILINSEYKKGLEKNPGTFLRETAGVFNEEEKKEWAEEYNKRGIVIESNSSGVARLFFSEEAAEFSEGIITIDRHNKGYGDIEPYVPYRKI